MQTYTCSQRQLNRWLSLVISVVTADVALILSTYNLFIFVASYLQKRWDRTRIDFPARILLTLGIGVPSKYIEMDEPRDSEDEGDCDVDADAEGERDGAADVDAAADADQAHGADEDHGARESG